MTGYRRVKCAIVRFFVDIQIINVVLSQKSSFLPEFEISR